MLPLKVYFDECELGNALGSHATIHKIYAVYIQLACLPPKYAGSLDNIFVAELFHSSDLKLYGPKVIFSKLIDQLKYLELSGITLNIGGNNIKVHFSVAVFVADNLGAN